jgi:L-proline amide hydrolase
MSSPIIKEGTVPFDVPAAGKPCETWYKIVGDLKSDVTPLVLLHGGPGLRHDYLLSLSELNELYGIPIIFYDQIGTARSTHLREKNGDERFWTEELFYAELNNLVEKLGILERGYDVLGHSWGGMLGATWAGTKPKGLRKLILSNAPATMKGWTDAYAKYRDALPEDIRRKILEGEQREDWEGEEYEGALMVFMKKHCAHIMPEEFHRSFEFAKEDGTVSNTM